MKEFSRRLESLIGDYDVDRKDLAKYLNIETQTISGWIKADKEPHYDTLCAIADYFRISTDYLLGRAKIRTELCPPLDENEENFMYQHRLLPSRDQYMVRENQNLFAKTNFKANLNGGQD